MSHRTELSLAFVLYLWFSIFNVGFAQDISSTLLHDPCSFKAKHTYKTKYSSVKFIGDPDPQGYGTRWICYDGKELVETRQISSGGHYIFAFESYHAEYLEVGGKYVKQNGKLVMLRMIVQEDTTPDADNHYWLLDFREKEPLVVGPMAVGLQDNSRNFDVIWNENSVLFILDDDGLPLGMAGASRGGYSPEWGKDERKFIENGAVTLELNGKKLPLLNKDGLYHEAQRKLSRIDGLVTLERNGKEISPPKNKKAKDIKILYLAYLYDYKQKKLIDAVVEE